MATMVGFESLSNAAHTGYNRHRLALGDISGDGHADVVIAGYDGLSVLYNTGD